MLLARVVGNVVSTHKNEKLHSHKLMLIHPVELDGSLSGIHQTVAIDFTGAGIGETVLVTQEGDAVQQILGHGDAPVHTIIVAIVDTLSLAQ